MVHDKGGRERCPSSSIMPCMCASCQTFLSCRVADLYFLSSLVAALQIGLLRSAKDRQAMWTSAPRDGTLAPMQQAKVWGIKWALDRYGRKYGFKVPQLDIAKAVTKQGGGHPTQCVILPHLIHDSLRVPVAFRARSDFCQKAVVQTGRKKTRSLEC